MRLPFLSNAPLPKFCVRCGCAMVFDYTKTNVYGATEQDKFDSVTGIGTRTRLEIWRCPKYKEGGWYPNYHDILYTGKKLITTIPSECN